MGHSLIYDKSILLLPTSTSFNFPVKISSVNMWKFHIKIINNSTIEPLTSKITTSGKDITIELYNWFSDQWVENDVPFVFPSDDRKIELSVMIRLYMNHYQPQKHLIVSVWKKTI